MAKDKLKEIADDLEHLFYEMNKKDSVHHAEPQTMLAKKAQDIVYKTDLFSTEIYNYLPLPKYSEQELEKRDQLYFERNKISAHTSSLSQKEKREVALSSLCLDDYKPSSLFQENDPRTIFENFQRSLQGLPALLASGCDRDLRPRMLCYIPLTKVLLSEVRLLANLL